MTAQIKSHVRYPKISGYVCDSPNVTAGIHFFLKKHNADCLAIYTSHHSMLDKIFKRSVTKSIAIHPSTPILVIHESDYIEDAITPDHAKMKIEVVN